MNQLAIKDGEPKMLDVHSFGSTAKTSTFNSILDDPAYQTNAMAWMARQVYRQANRPVKLVYPEHKRVTEILDALKNKNFEELKNRSQVTGLRLLKGNHVRGLGKPEFNLLEAAAVYDAEPLVRAAVTRQINLWFKDSPAFVSENPRLQNYIQKRFKQIAFMTGIPTLELFKQVVRSLIKYSNAFVIKVRNADLSGGIRKEENRNRVPIAGYFPVSPLTMFPFFQDGKLTEWRRFLTDGSKFQVFKPQDVIHLAWDLEEDFLFGKPRTLGVTEDIAAMRRIEENVEILIAKFLFPVYHFMVGTEKAPARYYNDGVSEIDIAKTMVQNMEAEGMLITSERYQMDVINAFKESLDATEYLKHFKTRLFTGLGVSAVDMGEGDTANRSTADNISQNLKDRVIEDQKTFSSQIQHHFLVELFLEHPEEVSALNAYDQVKLAFANVDLDSRIKWENHVLQKWNSNVEDIDETREQLNRQPMQPGARTHFQMIEAPLAIISAVDEPFTAEAKKAAQKRLTGAPEEGQPGRPRGGGSGQAVRRATRPVEQRSRPTNQRGTNLGPTRRRSSTEQRILGTRLYNFANEVVRSMDKDDVVSVITGHFPSEDDRSLILSLTEEAIQDAGSFAQLRAHLVSRLMGVAYKFPNTRGDNE